MSFFHYGTPFCENEFIPAIRELGFEEEELVRASILSCLGRPAHRKTNDTDQFAALGDFLGSTFKRNPNTSLEYGIMVCMVLLACFVLVASSGESLLVQLVTNLFFN